MSKKVVKIENDEVVVSDTWVDNIHNTNLVKHMRNKYDVIYKNGVYRAFDITKKYERVSIECLCEESEMLVNLDKMLTVCNDGDVYVLNKGINTLLCTKQQCIDFVGHEFGQWISNNPYGIETCFKYYERELVESYSIIGEFITLMRDMISGYEKYVEENWYTSTIDKYIMNRYGLVEQGLNSLLQAANAISK